MFINEKINVTENKNWTEEKHKCLHVIINAFESWFAVSIDITKKFPKTVLLSDFESRVWLC